VERVYLIGYSMGGRTTTGFLANDPNSGVAGYIGVGLLGGGREPFNTNLNLRKITIPVLDIYAEREPQDAQFAAGRTAMFSERYKQIPIPAMHSFKGYDSQIAGAVTAWLKEQEERTVGRK
jgi:pimeloyl-ACP methyl ester carboxylesterase